MRLVSRAACLPHKKCSTRHWATTKDPHRIEFKFPESCLPHREFQNALPLCIPGQFERPQISHYRCRAKYWRCAAVSVDALPEGTNLSRIEVFRLSTFRRYAVCQ